VNYKEVISGIVIGAILGYAAFLYTYAKESSRMGLKLSDVESEL